MSQVLSQEPPLQNCTNTLNLSPVSSKDIPINLVTPTKIKRQGSLDDYIDLTTPRLIQKSPKPRVITDCYIDEIVISDSDDESPPKRIKECAITFSTPTRAKSTPNIFIKSCSPFQSPQTKNQGLQTKLYQTPIRNGSTKVSPFKNTNSPIFNSFECQSLQNSVKHSTPVSEIPMPIPLQIPNSPDTHSESMNSCPHLTPIKPPVDTGNYFGQKLETFNFNIDEHLLPTNITTIELFASNSNLCTTPSGTSRNITLKNPLTKSVINESPNSLPKMSFVQSDAARKPTVGSQLADKLKTVLFEDSIPSELINSEFHTPTGKTPRAEEFFTPAPSIPFATVTATLTLQRLESNWNCYKQPGYAIKFLSDMSVEGKEIPNEWIDDSINLPLEGQTSFVKINSLQFVRSYITTPLIKISKFLLTPLVTYLVTSQDVNTTVHTANLLCDVIETHPAATLNNTECYRDVFTWELLNTSLETLCKETYIEVALDSLLKLYCDVIESEIHYQTVTTSYTHSLFWPKSSCVCLSDVLKDLIAYTCRLFSKHCPIIYTLFRLFELVLEWSLKLNEVIWHEQAAYEFNAQLSNFKTEDYSLFILCIGPPWFAGYIAQVRLREIGVPPLRLTPLSTSLKEFFTTYTDFLPTHPQEKLQETAINITSRDRLLKASKLGECHVIKQLIRDGCDPNICDDKNWNSLLRACWRGKVCSVEAIVEASLEKSTRVNIVQINVGATPLHLAAKCGNIDVCLCLLKMGGPSLLLHRDKDGYFPYEMARNSKLVKLLKIDYNEDKFDIISAPLGFNTNLRVPIDTNIILEFESMVCTALRGLFIKGGFDQNDVTACQQAHVFVQKLTSRINRSQMLPIKLARLTALINSYFV